MHERFFELPEAARQLVSAIQATIDEAAPLANDASAPPELAFNFRETAARYLPETIDAFIAVPPSQRATADEAGRSAVDSLLEQLSILERSTKRDLELLAKSKRNSLAANAGFLSERFDDHSKEISEAASASSIYSMPTEALEQWFPASATSAEILECVGAKLQRHFPGITELRFGGLFGMGRVEAVLVTIPQGAGIAFRYILSARSGMLETSVSKLVHGTTIQTIVCSSEEWLQSLYDDIVEQTRRHAEMRAPFARLFRNKEIL